MIPLLVLKGRQRVLHTGMTMPRVMYNPLTMVSTVFWCKCDLNKWKTKHVFPLFLVLDGLEALCFSSWCGIRDIIKTSPPTIYVVFLINQDLPFQTTNINREPTFFPKWNPGANWKTLHSIPGTLSTGGMSSKIWETVWKPRMNEETGDVARNKVSMYLFMFFGGSWFNRSGTHGQTNHWCNGKWFSGASWPWWKRRNLQVTSIKNRIDI